VDLLMGLLDLRYVVKDTVADTMSKAPSGNGRSRTLPWRGSSHGSSLSASRVRTRAMDSAVRSTPDQRAPPAYQAV
jgi:hypothetical protein